MIRNLGLTLMIGLLVSVAARAEEPARFKFKKDEVLSYSIIQNSKVVETLLDEKTSKPVEQEHVTKHSVIRRWKVANIDAIGVATLEMTIAAMRWDANCRTARPIHSIPPSRTT